MIRVIVGELASQACEGLVRPVRSDLAPLTAASRDVLAQAGEKVTERLGQMGTLPVGGAFITPGGRLAASFVIHVVTASEEESQSALVVQKALRNGLRRATEWGLESLAIPPLGIGVGTMEAEDAARAFVEILADHVDERQPPQDLSIVVSGPYEAGLFERMVDQVTQERSAMGNQTDEADTTP